MTNKEYSCSAIQDYREQSGKELQLVDLFTEDVQRCTEFSVDMNGLSLDFSKQRIDSEVLETLLKLAESGNVSQGLADLMAGHYTNPTENRFVRHTAMRWPEALADRSVAQTVVTEQEKLSAIVNKLRNAQWRGATGAVITDVVNLGVGGSDLGPRLGHQALSNKSNHGAVRIHFASSMDGSHLTSLLEFLRPESTVFIVASKSFGTIDTLANLSTACAWLGRELDQQAQAACHLIGVSSNSEKMTELGIPVDHQLNIDESVGGRFSVWSSIGLPLALSIGMDQFQAFLAGGRAMDQHVVEAPYRENIPVLLALLGIWNINGLDITNQVSLPYDGALSLLMPYLQQLEMESNGKSVTLSGADVEQKTNPLVWGGLGTDGQHAFFQWLHQGTDSSVADFIAVAPKASDNESDAYAVAVARQKQLAYANCVSQSRLLAFGDKISEANLPDEPQYRYRGNTPSNTIVLDELTPFNLGMLLAAYEHKVFVQSLLWDINAFDQPGVELGKTIAKTALESLKGKEVDCRWDSSTKALLQRGRQVK